ncbi:hypothetical protein [Hyphomonas beringensis]|uniref:hypothetical protein n=1 Tax=Hyphomonas beringensis TaxID=1280946 RepID=UPI0012DE173E|nr:hypothetical protein [Hyphomonas beringensis]
MKNVFSACAVSVLKKGRKSVVRFVSSGVMFSVAFSGDALAYENTPVKKIQILAVGPTAVMVTLEGAAINPDNCATSGRYVLQTTHPNYEALLAVLTSAYFSNETVKLLIHGCYQDTPNIISVYVPN